MAKCDMCGKIGHAGNNVSHSKRRTKTRFLPNIQRTTLEIKGNRRRATHRMHPLHADPTQDSRIRPPLNRSLRLT